MRASAAALAVVALVATCDAAQARSPFAWRGIVEGAYGPTWDHGARSRVLRWMPEHGFNAYVHAPKDDLYQRTYWRDPYPAAEMTAYPVGLSVNNPRYDSEDLIAPSVNSR